MHTAGRTTRPISFGTTAVAAARGVVATVKAMWRSWRNRRDVARLLEFDDHMLADIGLMRGDVTSALSSPADVDPSTRLRIFAVERRAGLRAQALERQAYFAAVERGDATVD